MATATDVVDPPAVFPARRVARARAWVPLLLLLVGSVVARLPALVNARGVHSDAAIVGLQAMHILDGEWSWFLWGAGYQASFDAALIAAAFAVTGPSALTLMVVPLVGHLILVGLAYDVLRRAVGRGSAAVACLPAQYWLAYRLTFLFGEDPVVVPLAAVEDRYRPYRDGFDAAPVVAYVFHPSHPGAQPEAVQAQLDAKGVPYRRAEVTGFTVLVVSR